MGCANSQLLRSARSLTKSIMHLKRKHMVFTGRLDSHATCHIYVYYIYKREISDPGCKKEVWKEHRLRHFGPRVVAVRNLGIHCQRQMKRKPVACTKTNHHRALGFCDTLLKAYSTELALEDLILKWRSRSLTVLASKGCKGVNLIKTNTTTCCMPSLFVGDNGH